MVRKTENTLHTPMMQQYFAAKERHPQDVLFFRMGDFYEMFFDDAETCAEILGIALTARGKDKSGTSIPMAGIPVKAADNYLAKLLRAGKRVAICEQVQDPKEAKGIVDREVVRVVTPGTVTDETVVDEKTHNYIAAIVKAGSRKPADEPGRKSRGSASLGLAWIDITTGEFWVWETRSLAALSAQVSRLSPAEIILPESVAFHLDRETGIAEIVLETFQTPFPDPLFDHRSAKKTLLEHFGTTTLEGYGCEHLKFGVRAGGALLRYLQDTQKVALRHISRVQAYQESRVLPIDRSTRRALEILENSRGERSGTLIASFDHTSTSVGARLLREWLLAPLTAVDAIVGRQEAVAEFVARGDMRSELVKLLREVHDLERIAARVSYGSANARDLLALARSLSTIPGVLERLQTASSSVLSDAASRMNPHRELCARLLEAIVDEPPLTIKEGGILRDGYHPELDELRQISTEGRQWFARFQQRESERSGISSLKVGFNRVFGYYVEVTNSHRDKIPADYVRKQTLKNAERYITPDLKEYENKVLNAKERSAELEYQLFTELRDEAAELIPSFQSTAQAIAETDVLVTFAKLADERNYARPTVNTSKRLEIVDGRHPVIEEVASTEPFIPNSIDLGDERDIMIITGPNMAGKSTYIRQVALLTLLAQTGSFIPATSAEIGVIDRLFTRVGASDDLARGQSTFMVEMFETANILNNATDRSLIVLDEVGRGTSTFDGVSLAWAITEHIAENVHARTLFATHYHELTDIARTYPTAANYNFAVKEWNEEIIFLRKVIEGGADKSYGIHVARLAGIPKPVIERAKEILSNLENQSLDLQDRPSLAKSRTNAKGADTASGPVTLQLDLFHSVGDDVLKELRGLDIDRMTPVEALQTLANLRSMLG